MKGSLRRRIAACALACGLPLAGAAAASAQGLPTEPISIGNGRMVVGAEVTATMAPEDPGFFNYTNYEYSALRNFRIGATTEVRAHPRLQFLAEVRLDHGRSFQPYGFYARIRPWPARRFDIQVGRVPPTFGAHTRRVYGTDNFLIGTPLGYQYLTSLRADAVPKNADELLRMRARGWLTSYSVGNTEAEAGLPLVNAIRWDTGVQAHGVVGAFEWTGSITTGSLSDPRVDDNNGGRNLAGRLVWRPAASTVIGASAARGAYISDTVERAVPGLDVDELTQRALGVDAEYSVGRVVVRGELLWSTWRLPDIDPPFIDEPVGATAVLVEGRYRLWPGIYVAARGEHLGFSDLRGSELTLPWDAPVRRWEVGMGWSIIRNVVLKGSWQRNDREGGRVRHESLGAVQVLYWF